MIFKYCIKDENQEKKLFIIKAPKYVNQMNGHKIIFRFEKNYSVGWSLSFVYFCFYHYFSSHHHVWFSVNNWLFYYLMEKRPILHEILSFIFLWAIKFWRWLRRTVVIKNNFYKCFVLLLIIHICISSYRLASRLSFHER